MILSNLKKSKKINISKVTRNKNISNNTYPNSYNTEVSLLLKPNSELLSIYHKVTSFKGNNKTQINDTMLNAKANTIVGRNYTQEEKKALIKLGITQASDISTFYKILHSDQQLKGSKQEEDNTKSLEKAIVLLANGFNAPDKIQDFLQLTNNEYSIETALNILKYGINEQDRETFKKLSTTLYNNRKLSNDEIITCIAFGIREEEVQTFINKLEKDYKGNKLNLFESALCTIHNLNEKQTAKFFELKSRQINLQKDDGTIKTYFFSTQEAILLAKNEFKEEELIRYVELKTTPFVYEAVRQHGDNANKTPNTELIIKNIKEKQSNEEIAKLAQFGFENFIQYKDFKDILAYFGIDEQSEINYEIQRSIAYIATLQDENQKNIFKDKNGKFNFDKLELISLQDITDNKLTPSQIEDYKKILEKMKVSFPTTSFHEISYIAAELAKLQDESQNNIFKDKNGNYDFKSLDLDSLSIISISELNPKQVNDFKAIFDILKSSIKNKRSSEIKFLASNLAKLQDENGKNIFLDENNTFNFMDLDFNSLLGISLSKLNSTQLKHFKEIFTKLKSSFCEEDNFQLTHLSTSIAKLQDENVKNIFKDENGNYNFDFQDLDSIKCILYHELNSFQIDDFKKSLELLKSSFSNEDNSKISFLAANFAKLTTKIKNTYKDDKGNINFNSLNLNELDIAFSSELKLEQISEFKKIFVALKNTFPNVDKEEIKFLAGNLAKLLDDNKENLFLDEKGNYNFNSIDIKSIQNIVYSHLTSQEIKNFEIILDILKTSFTNISNEERIDIATNLAQLQDKDGKNIFQDEENKFDLSAINAEILRDITEYEYTSNQIQNIQYLKSVGIPINKGIFIARDEDLMTKFRFVKDDIFWKGVTGESKDIFDLFETILKENDTRGTTLTKNDFDINLSNNYHFDNGTLNDVSNNISIDLQKTIINNKPILIIKNRNGEKEEYVAYDGAITLHRNIEFNNTNGNFEIDSTFSHISEEEIKALTTATKHFIINLFEKNKDCIIAKGISGIEFATPFNSTDLNTNETINKFKTILQQLHRNNPAENISIENLLRLIPKDSMLQIKPYATSNSTHDILYSISAEWKDANQKEWELRIHSHDLKFPNGNKHWIYRLGYKENNNSSEKHYYEPIQNDFIQGNKNPQTHILIEKEPVINEHKFSDYLLSNPHFQKLIREISISFNKTQLLKKVSRDLNIDEIGKNITDIKKEIISKCEQNAVYYYKYKKLINNLLEEQ